MKQTDVLIKIAGGECAGVGCDRCGKTIATSLDTSIHDILMMCDEKEHLCDQCRKVEERKKEKRLIVKSLREIADAIESEIEV